MNLQVANFQRRERAFVCPVSKLGRGSDVHGQASASSTNGCAFVYFTVQCCIEWASLVAQR